MKDQEARDKIANAEYAIRIFQKDLVALQEAYNELFDFVAGRLGVVPVNFPCLGGPFPVSPRRIWYDTEKKPHKPPKEQ